jgi:hypothetical protein
VVNAKNARWMDVWLEEVVGGENQEGFIVSGMFEFDDCQNGWHVGRVDCIGLLGGFGYDAKLR